MDPLIPDAKATIQKLKQEDKTILYVTSMFARILEDISPSWKTSYFKVVWNVGVNRVRGKLLTTVDSLPAPTK